VWFFALIVLGVCVAPMYFGRWCVVRDGGDILGVWTISAGFCCWDLMLWFIYFSLDLCSGFGCE